MNDILAMWGTPRSVSTAFERMMIQRGDFEVQHEPFSVCYYLSEDRISARFENEPAMPGYDYRRVLADIYARAEERPVFLKDMGYHISRLPDLSFLADFENTFIIRRPDQALPSLFHMWPDFTLEEAGYEPLYRVFNIVADDSGKTPVVIDSSDLLDKTEATVRAFCRAVDIPFMPEALSWEAGARPEWKLWQDWHRDASQSTGFEKASANRYVSVDDDPRLQRAYQASLTYYEKLFENRLVIE